jgi:glycosyltransferase involved in cell wall biosynthesis
MPTAKTTPRILVVADFGPGSGGGSWVLLKQFLRGLDWNRVYWWSLFDAPSSHEFGGRHQSCHVPPRLRPNKSLNEMKGWVFEEIIVRYASKRLLSYIRIIKPDFILFLAHQWGIPIVWRVMPKVKTNWHLALHDMPNTAGAIAQLGSDRADRAMKYLDDLYIKATSRAVISRAMADEMSKRTGVECPHVFRCAVEPETLRELAQPRAKPDDDPIRIGYAGSIVVEATFARLVAALRIVRERTSRKVEIHRYGWNSYKDRSWFDPEIVIEHGVRSELEMYKSYQELTWGLAIMGLDDSDPRYNRFSFPCKFTTSLAAGIPLICLGHHESSLCKLVANYQLGLCYSDLDTVPLADYLEKRLFDFSSFDLYRSEIARCARIEFNAEHNRQELHGLMQIAPGL